LQLKKKRIYDSRLLKLFYAFRIPGRSWAHNLIKCDSVSEAAIK